MVSGKYCTSSHFTVSIVTSDLKLVSVLNGKLYVNLTIYKYYTRTLATGVEVIKVHANLKVHYFRKPLRHSCAVVTQAGPVAFLFNVAGCR